MYRTRRDVASVTPSRRRRIFCRSTKVRSTPQRWRRQLQRPHTEEVRGDVHSVPLTIKRATILTHAKYVTVPIQHPRYPHTPITIPVAQLPLRAAKYHRSPRAVQRSHPHLRLHQSCRCHSTLFRASMRSMASLVHPPRRQLQRVASLHCPRR